MDEPPKQGDDVWLMFSVGTMQPAKVVAVDTVSWPPRARVTRSDTGEMLVVPVFGNEANVSRDPHLVRDGMHDSWDSDAAQRRRPTPPMLDVPVRKDTETSSSSARGQMPPLVLPPRDGGEKRSGGPPHNAPRPDGALEAKGESATMASIYQVFEDNFDLVTPRMETTPRHPERDDDGKASGKPSADDAGSSGNDAIRKLREELREDVRRGHSFLKSELQRVLYAQDRRLSSRLDLLEARIDRLQGVGSAGGGSGQYPPLLADSPRQRHGARDVGGARQYTDEQITPVRRELQAIRQEVEAQRALGKVMGTM